MDEAAPVIGRDLLAAVGEVMLYWGYLETQMLAAIPEGPRTASIYQRWLKAVGPGEVADEVKPLAAQRHLLAHGLCGFSALPSDGEAAHVQCRDANGDIVHITLDDLRQTAQKIDLFRLDLAKRNRQRVQQ